MAVKSTKRTSVTTELVLGQAAQSITKAIAELNAATESVNALSSKGEELTLLVSNKEQAIDELEVKYAEQERQLQVDLELKMRSKAEDVVTSYLDLTDKVAIPEAEWEALKADLTKTKADFETQTKKEVAVAVNSVKSTYEHSIALLSSEYKAKEAENLSRIGVLGEKNTFLEAQVTKMYQQMDAERAASIERAKASSVGTISVGTSNGK